MTMPRVLIADDHPQIIAAIERLVAQYGCEVVGRASDGVRLLEEAVRLQPDLVVLDLNMPGMSGIEACRELVRLIPRTGIIVLSADDDADVRQAVLAAGASAYVDKQTLSTDLMPALRAARGGDG